MKNKRIFLLVILCMFILLKSGSNGNNVYAEEGGYQIKVNMTKNCITIYEKNSSSEYELPVKAMACSVFENALTEEISYSVTGASEWKQMKDGTFSQYAVEFDTDIAICSSPYLAQSKDTLDMEKFNGIGENNSTQNIWVCTADAKWLYENCSAGNEIILYNDENSDGPLGKPDTIKLNSNSKFTNWDPTDNDENNPWKNNQARIEGVKDIEVVEGDEVDFLQNVKGYDICGNDITRSIIIMGSYDLKKEGTYTITYYLKDATGSQANQSANIFVKKNSGQYVTENVGSDTATPSEIKSEKSDGEKIKILIIIAVSAFAIAFMIIKYTKKD